MVTEERLELTTHERAQLIKEFYDTVTYGMTRAEQIHFLQWRDWWWTQ